MACNSLTGYTHSWGIRDRDNHVLFAALLVSQVHALGSHILNVGFYTHCTSPSTDVVSSEYPSSRSELFASYRMLFMVPVAMLAGISDAAVQQFVLNLLAVTAGNIVGGSAFVAIVYWLVYSHPRKS